MGIEYTLQVDPPDPARILPLIRRLPELQETEEGFNVGPFGSGWPSASLSLNPLGVYFCDYARTGTLLGLLVAWLAGEFGSVTVSEL
ncbi:hypothetical protein [Zavarzinella formosa]|uniref:hypothetical protein n=1 Tax=Zavarzinella formosa TaxID=360055 RepID=UPI000367833A|nr:hypothetical protein [Zavarzinella formosa]